MLKCNYFGLCVLLVFAVVACQPVDSGSSTQERDEPLQADVVPTAAATSDESEVTAAEPAVSDESGAENTATTSTEAESPRTGSADFEALIAEFVREEGEPNLLIDEKSPYLLQHAYNPVDWHPWGEEVFAKAAAENKPVFLSIGYSTCHWCHVMRDESFEDESVAALMNEAFVSIKVDREERPDIDNIYMNVAQITGNRGGWPLTIIMTPDQRPFFVATYIPKDSRFERVGMIDLIPQIEDIWLNQQGQVLEYADAIVNALEDQQTQFTAIGSGPVNVLDSRTLDIAYNQMAQSFDPVYGGFGGAPKFPSPHNLLFLLRQGQRTDNPEAVEMVATTLRAMRLGGVYDQIGYGFHRYSTDARWKLPHFEKMLYDQAMLAMAYTETYEVTKDPFFKEVAEEIFTYILRDMTDPLGGFYSAEDADSEGEEGIFYLWTVEELEALLSPEDADLMISMSAMTAEGNFLEEATGVPIGKNVVYWDRSPELVATELGVTPEELQAQLDQIRDVLFVEREKRIHPHKDDKILTDWNGLMIAALSKAGRAFDEPAYTAAAVEAADFMLATMRDENGRLLHRYREGEASILANVDDYAFLTWGLLELHESTFDLRYLEEVIALTAELDKHFWDDEVGGYYFTPDDGESLLVRQKQIFDSALPSGNSIAMLNLLRIGRITADASYESRAFLLAQSFYGQVSAVPTGFTQLLSGLTFGIGPSYEVIIIGDAGAADTEAMLAALRNEYIPNKIVLLRGLDESDPLVDFADYTGFYYAIDDQATAYVCQNYVCEFPTNQPDEMVRLLYESTAVETEQ